MTESSDPEAVARLICLQQLERKSRTRAELAETLRRREVPDAAAKTVLDRFTEVGLIDDAAYAQQWVEQRHRSHGSTRRALAGELRRKGVNPDTIAEATSQLDDQAEERAARGLVARKLRSLQRYDDATRTRRLVGMLARKGYSASLAYRVVSQELGGDGVADG
ncbi:MAG TPA: regulatory protein RecX [Mycobacteriales bacterium]|jgi:regulatory protein|nr:regulatory protein RecX [Mycobacteriales bacterium]